MNPKIILLVVFIVYPFTGNAEPTCNPLFHQKATETITRLETNLNNSKKLEASNCQKAITYHAGMAKKEAADAKQAICEEEAKQLKEVQGASQENSTQATSFGSTKELAEKNAKASEAMIAALQLRKKSIRKLRLQGQLVGSDFACWNNSKFVHMKAQLSDTDKLLFDMEAHLESMEKTKTEQALAAQKNAQTAAKEEEDLKSVGSETAASTVKPFTPLPKLKESKEKSFLEKNGPMMAALGVPLTGILLGTALGAKPDGGGGGDGGGGSIFDGILGSGGFGGNVSSFTSTCGNYSGGNARVFLQGLGITVNTSMTESEAQRVAAAANAIPACHKKYLRGITVYSNPNMRFQNGPYKGKCLPGRQTNKMPEINFTCYGSGIEGLIVHEFYHYIDMKMSGYLSRNYRGSKSCPVTQYVADNYVRGGNFNEEDMCDAYRIALCGKGSASTRSAGCVDSQISQAQQSINACK